MPPTDTRSKRRAEHRIQQLINKYFPPHSHPYRLFEQDLDRLLQPGQVVLEIGCGRSAPLLSRLKSRGARLIGIDMEPFTVSDPELELLQCSVVDMKPIQSETVSLAFSRSVMEHIDQVQTAYAEISRVLAPGGRYLFLTPNFWDYGSLMSWLIPNRLHGRVVKFTEGRDEADTFPTHYKSNTRSALKRLAAGSGLEIESIGFVGQYPNYLKFSPQLFRLGCWYAKLLERYRPLHGLQGWIRCTMRKPTVAPSPARGRAPR